MKLKVILLVFSCLIMSCNSTVDNNVKIKSLERKIDRLAQGLNQTKNDSPSSNKSLNNAEINQINARLSGVETSIKKLEKTFTDFEKSYDQLKKINQTKQPPTKPSGPWKRDYTYKTSVGNSYYQGPADAKVVITEWSDYF